MSEKLKWFNLKKNKCPKCGKDLASVFYDGGERGQLIMCTCGFSISPRRMKEIITSQVEADIDESYEDERR